MENKNEYVFAVKRGKRYVSGVACDDSKNIPTIGYDSEN